MHFVVNDNDIESCSDIELPLQGKKWVMNLEYKYEVLGVKIFFGKCKGEALVFYLCNVIFGLLYLF